MSFAGSGTIWWSEATDEPTLARKSKATTAREYARPTENRRMYDHCFTRFVDTGPTRL